MVVEYSVKTVPEPRAQRPPDLMRRENPISTSPMDRGGTEDVLFEGVKKIEFHTGTRTRRSGIDEWDTRRMERKSILPTRVKITLSALDENGKERATPPRPASC